MAILPYRLAQKALGLIAFLSPSGPGEPELT